MSKMIYWAWIPTFTEGINFDERIKAIEQNEETKWKKLDENGKNHILQNIIKPSIEELNYNLNDFNEISNCKCYSQKHIEEDKPDDTKIFLPIIFVDNENKIPYVLFSKYKEKAIDIKREDVICFGKIEYNFNKNNIPTGLIKTEIIYPSLHGTINEEEEVYQELLHREIYVCVRDIYHDHTFHEKGHDLLLPLVKASDRINAVKAILNFYENKIHYYQKEIKSFLYEEKRNVKKAITDILQAKGEMIYAQRFIELIDEERFFPFKNTFIHAYDSFEDFNKSIIDMSQLNESKKLTILTIWSFALTAMTTLYTLYVAIAVKFPLILVISIIILIMIGGYLIYLIMRKIMYE